MNTLQTKPREGKRSLKQIRNEGDLPAVFYGAGNQSTSIYINEGEFQKVWREAGESTAIKLSTSGGEIDALIHDVQVDPIQGRPIHADFLVVDMNKSIQTYVPLEFTGEAPAVKSGLGTLVKVMHEIEIEAKPKDLPHAIEVDISGLETIEDNITVQDVTLTPGVTSITKGDEVITMISQIREEEEEVPAEVDLSEIEVEKKGKKEEEEGGDVEEKKEEK